MPSKSQAQQKAAGMALAAKRGQIPVSRLQGAALEMYSSMTTKQLEELASTKRKRLPNHVKKSKIIKKVKILKKRVRAP